MEKIYIYLWNYDILHSVKIVDGPVVKITKLSWSMHQQPIALWAWLVSIPFNSTLIHSRKCVFLGSISSQQNRKQDVASAVALWLPEKDLNRAILSMSRSWRVSRLLPCHCSLPHLKQASGVLIMGPITEVIAAPDCQRKLSGDAVCSAHFYYIRLTL